MTNTALDTYRALRSIRLFAEEHGFTARIVCGKVEIDIPWVCANTGSTGHDTYTVTTMRDARFVLGY